MVEPNSDSDTKNEMVPAEESRLVKYSSTELNPWERFKVTLEKADAVGRVRMVIADFLIEEGLMKRRSKK